MRRRLKRLREPGAPDLSPIAHAIEGAEWVVHAASQDLPCLAEVGLRPQTLFDTERYSNTALQSHRVPAFVKLAEMCLT